MGKPRHGRAGTNTGGAARADGRDDSPAARYAAFRRRQRERDSAAGRFADTLDFTLDGFQRESLDALEAGSNVLVAAPTGAGKTIVADFAVFLAQERNVKAFYTTPIKALSNQKYHDLAAVYGADRVGLLTGDTSVNPDADIVVMTTEVLRNMLYERSTSLGALRYVILDEVHYLADRFRGPVWEEVIIHLPERVRIIGLSATVSNVEDFSDWIASVRGDTSLIVSEHRPVPLEQHVIVQASDEDEPELYDLYRSGAEPGSKLRLNPALVRRLEQLDKLAERRAHADGHGGSGRGRAGRGRSNPRWSRHQDTDGRRSGKGGHGPAERHQPRRWAVVDELDAQDLLPGIFFIFSRAGCDAAVDQCLRAGLTLTTDREARRIRMIADEMTEGQLSHDDLKALHYGQFRFALEQGFAAHHAGMVALFREIVETCFAQGLLKTVFATETLALGINMPARSVIVEKLEKYDGTGIVPLTPGEFTQLTGRAGRRGTDTIGHAIVVDHHGFTPATAAALSSRRVYPIHSSFTPTFNMAVNLLNASDAATARTTLDHSFAQWEANESATSLESRIDAIEDALHGYEQAMACTHGDITGLLRLRMELTDLERQGRRELKHRQFPSERARRAAQRELEERIASLRRQESGHPCRQCPDLSAHMRWGHRWTRETRELERLRHRYESRTGSVARQFDRICAILLDLRYLERTVTPDGGEDLVLTGRGQLLRRLFSERDLLIAQCIVDGTFDDLGPEALAAVASALVYEPRRGAGGPDGLPGGRDGLVAQAIASMEDEADRLDMELEDHGLDPMPGLEFGAVPMMFDWACGHPLADVLDRRDMTPGDFVRTGKRLADVLGQIAQAAEHLDGPSGDGARAGAGGEASLAARARRARDLIDHGVVAYSGVDE